jgi:large subunit ribosomal protein L25
MYGVEETTISLAIERLQLEKMLSLSHSVIDLNYDGKVQGVVVRDIQYHPVKGNIIHVDFLRIKAGQEIKISVPIKFVGESVGVEVGGVFQEIKSQISIITLPRNLPEVIEVDISKLAVNDAFHVSDLQIENITIEDDPSDTICSVVPPKKVIEPTEVEEGELEEEIEGEEETAEPEVITAKKSEEE